MSLRGSPGRVNRCRLAARLWQKVMAVRMQRMMSQSDLTDKWYLTQGLQLLVNPVSKVAGQIIIVILSILFRSEMGVR